MRLQVPIYRRCFEDPRLSVWNSAGMVVSSRAGVALNATLARGGRDGEWQCYCRSPVAPRSIRSTLRTGLGRELSGGADNPGLRAEEGPGSWAWSRQPTGVDFLIFTLWNGFRLIESGWNPAQNQGVEEQKDYVTEPRNRMDECGRNGSFCLHFLGRVTTVSGFDTQTKNNILSVISQQCTIHSTNNISVC